MELGRIGLEIRKNKFLVIGAGAALILLLITFANTGVDPQEKSQETDRKQLTTYQRGYVDCPDRYLKLCTEMSKKPTEEVEFQKAEEGKLYLEMPRSNSTMVVKIQEGGSDGYLIRIED